MVVFACTVFSGITPKLRVAKEELGLASFIWEISFARWSVEASVISNARIFLDSTENAFHDSTLAFLKEYGWKPTNFFFDIGMMIALGVAWRVLALIWIHFRPNSL